MYLLSSFNLHPRHIGTGLYNKVVGLYTAAGFAPEVTIEAHEMSIIVGLVAAGVGVSIVPKAMCNIRVEGAHNRPEAALRQRATV
jgi:DNA-binding transcriptional LysR family regulator